MMFGLTSRALGNVTLSCCGLLPSPETSRLWVNAKLEKSYTTYSREPCGPGSLNLSSPTLLGRPHRVHLGEAVLEEHGRFHKSDLFTASGRGFSGSGVGPAPGKCIAP